MSIANRVRRIYEPHPYPPPKMRQKSTGTLPAAEWIEAMRESPKPFAPRRILAAGCGVGTEAFRLADRFPSASIIAVDFSKRSIAAAKKTLRRMPFRERLQFSVADLSDENLREITGDRFDFVTCHGVLSYIAQLSQLIDRLQPTSFLQFLISRRKPAPIAWDDPPAVMALHPHLTRLYEITGPRSRARTSALRTVVLKSVPVKTKVELEVPQWEVDILRGADGTRSIREIPGKTPVSPSEVAEAMYIALSARRVEPVAVIEWDRRRSGRRPRHGSGSKSRTSHRT